MTTLMLSGRDIARHLSMQTYVALMADLNKQLAGGAAGPQMRTPLQQAWPLFDNPQPSGFLGLMPSAYWEDEAKRYVGCKCLSVFPNNRANASGVGLSSHQGIYILFDGTNGRPLLVADAGEITALRTAANSAAALRYLLPTGDAIGSNDSSDKPGIAVGIVGTGEQARRHAIAFFEAMAHTLRPIELIRVWGRNHLKQAACVASIVAAVPNGTCVEAASLADLLTYSDAVCTLTSSNSPVIFHSMIAARKKPLLVMAVGACTPRVR